MRICFLFLITFIFHGKDSATYTITKDNNSIYVSVKLDVSDSLKALNTIITKENISNYLIDHMEYTINDQATDFSVDSFKKEHNHLIVNLLLAKEFETITKLQIKNTSLFEINNKQSNIIQLRFDGMFRDFLINKEKPTITITL